MGDLIHVTASAETYNILRVFDLTTRLLGLDQINVEGFLLMQGDQCTTFRVIAVLQTGIGVGNAMVLLG